MATCVCVLKQYIFFFFCFFLDRVSLCSPGCPGTHSVDQAGLELRNPPASASQVPAPPLPGTFPFLKKEKKILFLLKYVYVCV
jgi:hypothetical protein